MRKRIFLLLLVSFFTSMPTFCQNGCSLSALGRARLGEVYNSSGNLQLDRAMFEAYNFIKMRFGVNPSFQYVLDADSPNAFASPKANNPLYPDGSVYFGLQLMQAECTNSYLNMCSSLVIVLAHELAHVVDFKYGSGFSDTKRVELFADYLAGAMVYVYTTQFKQINIQENALSLFSKGDYAFNDEDHHGTPQERLTCMLAGFNDAMQIGFQFTLPVAIQRARMFVSGF
jgi:hypothetical protein